MDLTDIRYIPFDLACNASQEAWQGTLYALLQRIACYIGLYVRHDGAVMELTSDVFFAVWERTVLNFLKSGILMLISTSDRQILRR